MDTQVFGNPTFKDDNGGWSYIFGYAGFKSKEEALSDHKMRMRAVGRQRLADREFKKEIVTAVLSALKGESIENAGDILKGLGYAGGPTDSFIGKVRFNDA